MTLNITRRARIICVAIFSTVGAVTHAGAAHADEGVTLCDNAAPIALAKRPAAAISYAPRHPSIYRHRVPAMLRKPAPEVGCTPESLSAAASPLSVPAVGEAPEPVVAEAISPVPMETPLAVEAPETVVAEVIPPVSVETPQGAIAAAAAGGLPAAAIPIGMLAAYIGLCVVGHSCGGDSGTVGGQPVSTTGTTGTY